MSDQVQKQSFCVIYDGESHEEHEIHIHTLGKALTSLGDLLIYTNEVVNENNEGFDVKINANFIKGSFGFEVEVFQGLANAKDILQILGVAIGGTAAATTVFSAIEWLKGREIDQVSEVDETSTIKSGDEEKECPAIVAKLVSNSKIRKAIDKLVRNPLQHEGTDVFRIKSNRDDDNDSAILSVDKKSSHSYTPLKRKDIVESSTVEKRIKFIAADISKATGWKIDIDGKQVSAKMEDDGFRERLELMNEVNIFGKSINVRLKTVFKTLAGEEQSPKYFIEHVFLGSERSQ